MMDSKVVFPFGWGGGRGKGVGNNVNPGLINPWLINRGVYPFSGWIQTTFGVGTPP